MDNAQSESNGTRKTNRKTDARSATVTAKIVVEKWAETWDNDTGYVTNQDLLKLWDLITQALLDFEEGE